MLLAAMIVLSAFFALSETALLSVSRFKVRYWVEKKKFGADYVKKLKDSPEVLLSTVLIGNNVVNTAAAAITTSINRYFPEQCNRDSDRDSDIPHFDFRRHNPEVDRGKQKRNPGADSGASNMEYKRSHLPSDKNS